MNKVITVNLNGNAYQVEESGYNALDEYLADAEAKLKDNPDLVEIMADLEQAIADKCNQHLTPNKNVVTRSEINQILMEMGRVDADAGKGSEAESEKEAGAEPEAQVRFAWRLALGRDPSMDELTSATAFISAQMRQRSMRDPSTPENEIRPLALADFCQVIFAMNEFIYVD